MLKRMIEYVKNVLDMLEGKLQSLNEAACATAHFWAIINSILNHYTVNCLLWLRFAHRPL
jgi:hypothetical protein